MTSSSTWIVSGGRGASRDCVSKLRRGVTLRHPDNKQPKQDQDQERPHWASSQPTCQLTAANTSDLEAQEMHHSVYPQDIEKWQISAGQAITFKGGLLHSNRKLKLYLTKCFSHNETIKIQ